MSLRFTEYLATIPGGRQLLQLPAAPTSNSLHSWLAWSNKSHKERHLDRLLKRLHRMYRKERDKPAIALRADAFAQVMKPFDNMFGINGKFEMIQGVGIFTPEKLNADYPPANEDGSVTVEIKVSK